MRKIFVLLSLGALFSLCVFLAPSFETSANHTGGMNAISIDMDITGNTAAYLGSREACRRINPPGVIDIDVTASGVPDYVDNPPPGRDFSEDSGGIISFFFRLEYSSGAGGQSVTSHDPYFLVSMNPGSSVFDTSDSTPDGDGSYEVGIQDDGHAGAEDGSGVLSRISLSISASAVPGTYSLNLGDPLHQSASLFFYSPDVVNDATLAIGVPCPDSDGDGLDDSVDSCPTLSGPAANGGCPVGPPAVGGTAGLFDPSMRAQTQEAASSASIAYASLLGAAITGTTVLTWRLSRRGPT